MLAVNPISRSWGRDKNVDGAVLQLVQYADDEFGKNISGDTSKGCGVSLSAYEGRLCEECKTLNPEFAPYMDDFGSDIFYPIRKEGYPVRKISMAHDSLEVIDKTEEEPQPTF